MFDSGLIKVLSLGAGVQSTTLLLMSLRGDLPKLDACIFADTQWEPKAVYKHLEWLSDLCSHAGLPLYQVTAGDLRQDAIDFRSHRMSLAGAKQKRYASIPSFIKNLDGTVGRVKRQCTKEYKIAVVDRCLRRVILGLKPKERIGNKARIEHWFGISADEERRAVYPGRYHNKVVGRQRLLFDEAGEAIKRKVWKPTPWEIHAYPLLDSAYLADRTNKPLGYLPQRMTRQDCADWLKRHYPDRDIPRSACIGCPFRSNEEWRRMRDEQPEEWADAVAFDKAQRQADHDGQVRRGLLVGQSYIHRQCLPLDMVDLDVGMEVGAANSEPLHCGMLADGFDGLCGV